MTTDDSREQAIEQAAERLREKCQFAYGKVKVSPVDLLDVLDELRTLMAGTANTTGAEAACTCPAYDGVGRMACDTCGHESTAHEAHDGPCSASSSSSDRFIEGIAEAVAKVTPCACSAQRARADRAEAALAEAWDAGWEMRETARLHGREGDDFNPWRGGS